MSLGTQIKAIPGFPFYYADKIGNIYSITPADQKKFFEHKTLQFKQVKGDPLTFHNDKAGTIKLKKLKPQDNRTGYLKLTLKVNGKSVKEYVHRLVLLAWRGPFPAGKETNHIDMNTHNNKLENLEFVTRAENILHSRLSQQGDITKTKEGDPF